MKRLILLFILLINGCAMVHPVNIPVNSKFKHDSIPLMPVLPISQLTEKSSYSQTMKAYVASVALLKGWGQSLTLLLNGYQ